MHWQLATVALILLGFAASFGIRTYLLNHLERELLDQQQTLAAAPTARARHRTREGEWRGAAPR